MAAKTTEEVMDALKKLATHMAEESKKTDANWNEIADHISKASGAFDKGFLAHAARLSGFATPLKQMANTITGAITGNREQLKQFADRFEELRQKLGVMNDESKAHQSKEFYRVLNQAKMVEESLKAHQALTTKIADVLQSRWVMAFPAVVASLRIGLRYSHLINDELIQASASVEERAKLMHDISATQGATGNQMKDMAKAANALVHYGFDLKSSFRSTLETVVKMEEGLGVSYQTSAEMAVVMQRVGVNLHSVADGIARVKADTALSAEQATKFATEIGRAVNMLKPGSGSMADQVIEYVNRLGGALQQVGGNASDIKDLLIGFTQEKGMMGAASVGATPDFLASPEGTRKVTEQFVKYVDAQLQGTSGFQRMATIQLLAQQFGTSADLIVNARKMLEEYNGTQRHTTNLQDEWRMQTSELGKTFSKISESFKSIIQQALLPILQYIRPVLAGIAEGFQFIAKHSAAAWVAGTALIAVTAGATVQFYRLAAAISSAWMASMGVETVANAKLGGTSGLLARWMPKFNLHLATIAKYAGGIAAAATAGYAVGTLIEKGLHHMGWDLSKLLKTSEDKRIEFMNQQAAMNQGRNAYQVLAEIGGMVRGGSSSGDIQKYLMKNIGSIDAIRDARSAESRQRMVDNFLSLAGDEITRQRALIGNTTLTARTEDDRKRDEAMIQMFREIAANTALQNKLLERAEKHHALNEEKKLLQSEDFNRQRQLEQTLTRNTANARMR